MNSRTLLAVTALMSVAATLQLHAVTISQWTFESPNVPPILTDSATQTGINPAAGSGTASGTHASLNTDWKTSAGSGSTTGWSANNWAINDYWQFEVATTDFINIKINWDQRSSSTGPHDFGLFYSTDGNTFTSFGSDYILADSYANFSRDLSSITNLNNDSSVFFRLVATSGASGTSGTSVIDNFTVTGETIATNTVPDTLPFTFIASFLLGFLAFAHKICDSKEPARAKAEKARFTP